MSFTLNSDSKTEDEDGDVDYCSQQVTTCSYMEDKCSRFLSTKSDGEYCRSFALRRPLMSELAKLKYCHRYKTNDCLCINKEENEIYRKLKPRSNTEIKDWDWYLPCKDENRYLIPEDILMEQKNAIRYKCSTVNPSSTSSTSSVCSLSEDPPKDQVCLAIKKNFRKSGLGKSEFKNKTASVVDCPLIGEKKSGWSSYKIWLILLSTLLVVLVIGIAIFFAIKRRR